MGAISLTTGGAEHRADVRLTQERLAVWLIAFAGVLYLALSGGGYDVIARSEVGLVLWWVIVIGALVGVLPRARLSAGAVAALLFLGCFLVWTWVGTTWSGSEGLTLLEAGRVSAYVGMLVGGLCIVRPASSRALLNGVASAIAVVAGLAVLYRIAPALAPADTGARFFYVDKLLWPFEYSDAVGEFAALGLPVLLVIAISGRTLLGRAAGAVSLVLAAVCLAMTGSRGGILAAVVGSAILGLLAVRLTGLLRTRRRQAKTALIALIALLVLLLLATGAARHLWNQFRGPQMGAGISGTHRYQYWTAAVHAFDSSPLHGIGPGTFQFFWAQHNSLHEFVLNAHSLYFETLAETGIVGLLLIVGLLATVLVAGSLRALRTEGPDRLTIAAATAGAGAFCVAAAFDWVWQIAAVPSVALLLAAVALGTGKPLPPVRRLRRTRIVLVLAAIPALWAIIVPLATTVAIAQSRADAATGDYGGALQEAASSQRIEPGAATPYLQRALILEQLGDLGAAQNTLNQAARDDPTNWRIWLIASRLATEADQPRLALADYLHARSLNATSPLFTKAANLIPIGGRPLSALVVPPGKAGANQYVETIPGAAGNFANPSVAPTAQRFDPRPLATLAEGSTGATALARRGPAGRAAAELAIATAYTIPARGAPTVHTPGHSPLVTIASVLAGSDAGGLGPILPALLIFSTLAALAIKYRRARLRQAPISLDQERAEAQLTPLSPSDHSTTSDPAD